MPNGEDRDIIRMLSAIRGFRIKFGGWPKIIKIEPHVLNVLQHFLSKDEFVKLTEKIEIVIIDDEDFIAENDKGQSYSLMEYGHPRVDDPNTDPAKWLGLSSYIRI
jgi:hypothetical protein